MKIVAVIFLAITMFIVGMCIQGARDDIKTRNWINPDNIGTVTNPFWENQAGDQE
jgi:hypothetical protein